MAPVTISTVPRDVLLDRLDGLLYDQAEPANPSDLQERLDAILGELLTDMIRATYPDDCGIVDQIEAVIFRMMLEGIENQGLARHEDLSVRMVRAALAV
jgi:hypothetical protein